MRNMYRFLPLTMAAILFSPIFLSYGDGVISFGKSIWDLDRGFTTPLSFLFVSACIIVSLPNIFVKLLNGTKILTEFEYYLVGLVLFFHLYLIVVFGVSRQMLLTTYSILSYIYFRSIFINLDHSQRLKILSFSSLIFFGFTLTLLLGSLYRAEGYLPGDLIPGFIHVYNYLQYYSIAGVLLLSAGLSLRFWWLGFFTVIWLCIDSVNLTSLICCLLLVPLWLKKMADQKLNAVIDAFVFMLILCIFVIPIWAYYYSNIGLFEIGDPSELGIWARVINWTAVIDNFGILNLMLPMAYSEWFATHGWGMHNQFLSLVVHGGLLYASVVYLLYLSLIIHVEKRYILGFMVVVFVAGSMVEVLSHPYIMIQIMFLLALCKGTQRSD